ncbi:MAG: helix-turn-helix domain-containing protein, partial [Firmicutes bacterium]|nr:helix-turn-helix domain-containing protein [Bacillota bacterium]
MYDFSNFGQRLQELRKKKGMTQEDLAHRIGVSAQAVSKWENNQSYPDITSIPDLAQILSANISYLFGEQPSPPALTVQFPDSYQDLPLVSTFKHVACYSNKAVESKDESGVKFADGSTAELSTRMAVNKGQGEILFLGDEESMYDYELQVQGIDTSVTSKQFEFGHTHSVNITTLYCTCKIVPSQDDKTRVYAKGSPKFLHTLYVEYDQSEM